MCRLFGLPTWGPALLLALSAVTACGGQIERPGPPDGTREPNLAAPDQEPPGRTKDAPPRQPTRSVDCAALASAKPAGRFAPTGSFAATLDRFREVEVVVAPDLFLELVFSTDPSGVYENAGAIRSGSARYRFYLPLRSPLAPGSYPYEGGAAGEDTCTDESRAGGSATWEGSGQVEITKVTEATVEGSIGAPPEQVTFVAALVVLPPYAPSLEPSPLVCCP